MKNIIYALLAFNLILFSMASLEGSNMNKEGSSSNMGTDTVEAITYGLANSMKMDQFFVDNQKDFKPPQIVEKLPPRALLTGGNVETVEEVTRNTPDIYYDGSRGLKITVASCKQYTTKKEVCMKQASCGWCGQSESCISGNNLGPLEPCMKGQFSFTSPNQSWSSIDTDHADVKTKNIAGVNLTTITSPQ